MIRLKSVKNCLLFGIICIVLLLLNNLFIDDPRNIRVTVVTRFNQNLDKNYIINEKSPCELCSLPAHGGSNQSKYLKSVREQLCTANNGKEMKCLRDDSEFYFPFSFLKKQFDVSGKLSKDSSRFEWFTSYSKIRVPDGNSYDPFGPFGHFATYSVETRDRVRCISAETGVPMSTQWKSEPYYYPIQIAQYGLQHYSRMKLSNGSVDSIELGLESREWKGSAAMHDTSERTFFLEDGDNQILNITSASQLSNAGCYLFLNSTPSLHVVSFDWRPISNASFTILVKNLDTNTLILLNYITEHDKRCVWSDTTTIFGDQISFSFSLGKLNDSWYSVTRDALMDASRALSSLNTSKRKEGNVVLHPGDIRLVSLGFRGKLTVRQKVRQSSSANDKFFITAADWMVKNQNKEGGWSVPVERSIADRRLVLGAGWHSAMAQGHALSLLIRAYAHTKDIIYLRSAVNGLKLFEKPASLGGVMNELFGHPWYEEYPTTPGSFVLNGFMYALIGLYDMSKVIPAVQAPENIKTGPLRARALFEAGLDSLRLFIPLYDTGSGSIYDLRHIGLQTAPNLARWDYHAVHVYLLKWLVQITGDKILDETADRWIAYSYGKRAKHN